MIFFYFIVQKMILYNYNTNDTIFINSPIDRYNYGITAQQCSYVKNTKKAPAYDFNGYVLMTPEQYQDEKLKREKENEF